MAELLAETRPVARKSYDCMAWPWIVEGIESDDLTDDERLALENARKKGFKILPGEKYIKQSLKDGADPYTFRAIPELHAICLKYELYLD